MSPRPSVILGDIDSFLEAFGWNERERRGDCIVLDAHTRLVVRTHQGDRSFDVHTMRGDVRHGFTLSCGRGYTLFSAYSRGLEHGTALRFHGERLFGWYVMHEGTGLWLSHDRHGALHGSCDYVGGERHGAERFWREGRLTYERHFRRDVVHGITRKWDEETGVLSRDDSHCVLDGEPVSWRDYENACQHDPTLAPYRPEDDEPIRELPTRPPLDEPPTLGDVLTRLIPESLAPQDDP